MKAARALSRIQCSSVLAGPDNRGVHRAAIAVAVAVAAAVLVAVFGGTTGRAAQVGCPRIVVTTLAPSNVSATSATLNGTISGGCSGQSFDTAFGYGTSGMSDFACSDYDTCAAGPTVMPNGGSASVSLRVNGLTPSTAYHTQLYWETKGEVGGGDVTFSTTNGSSPPPPPPKPPEDPHADLAVYVNADKANAAVGDTLTYTVEVRNWGPREATNVTLTDVLPAQVEFVSVSSSAPPTTRRLQDAVSCSGGATVVCHIGVLGFGSSSTTTIVTQVVAAGDAIDTATVSNPDQPDPNGANSSGTTTVAVATPTTTTTGSVPPPVYGQTFNVRPVSGTVLVRLPGTTAFVPLTGLTSIPEGTEIDTTNGRVELTSASDPGNDTQTAQFYSGRFVLLYAPPDIGTAPQVPGTVTTLVTSLVLSAPLDCATTRHSAAAQAKKKVRFLWGTGKGNFRTRGRYAAATVRGTIWFTEDTCTTTTVHVVRGVVDVYDVVLNKHFLVHAGQSHTAHRKP